MYVLTFDEDTAHVDGLPVHLMSMMFNVITGGYCCDDPDCRCTFDIRNHGSSRSNRYAIRQSFNVVIAISVCVGFLGMLSGLTSSFI